MNYTKEKTGRDVNMKKLLAIGEALIDFIPRNTGVPIKQVESFKPAVGGAPANVCGAFTKLGGESKLITQLGNDPFGDKIVDEFEYYGIGCEYVSRINDANTSLAFVALKDDGNREFSFYRKPGADMLLKPETIKKDWFKDAFALHFCSVSIGDFPMKDAHEKAIEYAANNGAIISFDPNVRLALWDDIDLLRKRINEFIPKADIVKISDEELEFITGKDSIEDALPQLFTGRVKLVIYTKGSEGAEAYTKSVSASAPAEKVNAIDTTGAGDAFIGSLLYQLAEDGVTTDSIADLTEDKLEEYLKKSNGYCAKSVLENGAIASYPTSL